MQSSERKVRTQIDFFSELFFMFNFCSFNSNMFFTNGPNPLMYMGNTNFVKVRILRKPGLIRI